MFYGSFGGFSMGFVNRIMKTVDIFTEDESEEKGNDFEKYVADLFDEDRFSVVQWSTDITRKHDRFVEADMSPDLIIRYEPKGEMFCVECKFRSDLYESKLNWSNSQQLEHYKKYASEHILPFLIVIGLGGDPIYPKRMFCIPLEEAKYPALFPSVFERFERDPDKNFFWKNGVLT
jgi:hypothetical protein